MSDEDNPAGGKKRGLFGRLFGGRESAPAEPAPAAPAPVEAAEPEAPAEPRSWWRRLKEGLARSSSTISQGIVEVFTKRGAIFFRLMGQIPLRRGDEASTVWAMDMATRCLADGSKLGLYPEGTRSPDPTKLHRLHRRILIPVLQAHPGVPVYGIGTSYEHRRWRRIRVTVNISEQLDLHLGEATPDEVTDVVRDALLRLGGQEYVHAFARDVKSSARPS